MTPARPRGHLRAAVAASVVGSALEWFNFALFASLAAVMSPLFFAPGDPASALLLGFGTLGAKLLARPVGGVVLGAYADRMGRRNALVAVFGLMATSSFALALLPTREQAGLLAPTLLVLCLLAQGFSAGGEFSNASTALVEYAPRGRRGFYGSLQLCSQALAILAATALVLSLETGIGEDAMASWGWRLPFLLGSLVGPVGLYLRLRSPETPDFEEEVRASPSPSPLAETLRSHRRRVLACLLVFGAVLGPSYLNTLYLPQVAELRYGVARGDALLTVVASALILAALIPLGGFLSDAFPRHRVVAAGAAGMVVAYLILFPRFAADPSFATLLTLQVAYSFPYAALVGASATLAAEAFPARVRATGGALAYNLAAVAFGATAPLAVEVMERLGGGFAPAGWMAATCAGAAAGAVWLGRDKPGPGN